MFHTREQREVVEFYLRNLNASTARAGAARPPRRGPSLDQRARGLAALCFLDSSQARAIIASAVRDYPDVARDGALVVDVTDEIARGLVIAAARESLHEPAAMLTTISHRKVNSAYDRRIKRHEHVQTVDAEGAALLDRIAGEEQGSLAELRGTGELHAAETVAVALEELIARFSDAFCAGDAAFARHMLALGVNASNADLAEAAGISRTNAGTKACDVRRELGALRLIVEPEAEVSVAAERLGNAVRALLDGGDVPAGVTANDASRARRLARFLAEQGH